MTEGENSATFTGCLITNAAPGFVDAAAGDFRLAGGSFCIDAGLANEIAITGQDDLAGSARLAGAAIDIGTYEFTAGDDLACGIAVPLTEAIANLDVTLGAIIYNGTSAGAYTYFWKTNDVAAGTDATLPLNLATPGYYSVGLTVGDGIATASVVCTNLLYVVPPVIYVTNANPLAIFPYATPATAATSVQSAVDAARAGCVVSVAPGSYPVSSMIMLSKAIDLRSQVGRDRTRLYRSGNVGLLQLGHGKARVHGFDFDGGYPRVLQIWGNGGMVSNCVVRNGSYTAGVGVGIRALAGHVTHCAITNNASNREGSGIGVWMSGNTVIENCLIAKNTTTHAQTKGGGVYLTGSSVVRNCTITGNKAGNGGGVYTENGGTVENCIISDNQILATAGPGDPDWYHAGTAAIYRNNCTPVDVGTDCVTAAPNFIDAGGGDYRIASGSACVDAGIAVPGFDGITDFYGGARVSGDVIDIGAHEVVRQGVGCGIATSTPALKDRPSGSVTASTTPPRR